MAIPTEHASREYLAFLRIPASVAMFRFGTVDQYRGGYQHFGLIAAVPSPDDSALNDFGLVMPGGFTVEIADEPGNDDWYILFEDESRILLEDGSGDFIMEY
jgi:hypothetical protein